LKTVKFNSAETFLKLSLAVTTIKILPICYFSDLPVNLQLYESINSQLGKESVDF